VYGQTATTTIDLSGRTLPTGDGVDPRTGGRLFFRQSLASGDINGDGRPDLVIGAPAYLGSVVSSVWVIFAGVGQA
jgi:hypothetical protein